MELHKHGRIINFVIIAPEINLLQTTDSNTKRDLQLSGVDGEYSRVVSAAYSVLCFLLVVS